MINNNLITEIQDRKELMLLPEKGSVQRLVIMMQ